jgi:hypothetical protein
MSQNLMRAELELVEPVRLRREYIWVLGVGLLLDGAVLLLVDWLGVPVPVNATDWRHNLLHVVWGIALLVARSSVHWRKMDARFASRGLRLYSARSISCSACWD